MPFDSDASGLIPKHTDWCFACDLPPPHPPKKEVAPALPYWHLFSAIFSNCVYMLLSCDFCVGTSCMIPLASPLFA